MAYTVPEILIWAKISQPLARYNETKKQQQGDSSADPDLDIKIYNTRMDVQYEYDQDPDSEYLYSIANYLYALCFPYVLTAQETTIGGGTITPITPSDAPDPYDFDVNTTDSFILTGATSKTFPVSWRGFNILFIRGHITQSLIDDGVNACYSWDRDTATLTLINGAAQTGENFQFFPLS